MILARIAVALERIADQRDRVLADAEEIDARDRWQAKLTAGEIVDVVSAICACDITSKSRVQPHVWGRWAAMVAIKERLHLSTPQIGKELGGLDHSSVVYGLTHFQDRSRWSTWDLRRWNEINNRLDKCQEEPTIESSGAATGGDAASAFKLLANQSV